MMKIGTIGGGFAGTMATVHLIERIAGPVEIVLIDERKNLAKGTAYAPYSDKHLLNVAAGRMSAYPDDPGHFLRWVMAKPEFRDKDEALIASSFLPRRAYGEYLADIWEKALRTAAEKDVRLTVIDGRVLDLDTTIDGRIALALDSGEQVAVDHCIIATGNQVPRDPRIANTAFYPNARYFQDPWRPESVKGVASELPVLIVGNGLTMVDTVFGLLEGGFKGTIISISPNGFNILPHRHSNLKYAKLAQEITHDVGFLELVGIVNRHIKIAEQYGVSAEPIIDSLRPYTQHIWQRLTNEEKRTFIARLRHLWGVARHRIPQHSHDRIQQLRIDGRLHIRSGRMIDLTSGDGHVVVDYFDKKEQQPKRMLVSRVINCTGPETDLMNLEGNFLKKCLLKGILKQDDLKLGISADTTTFEVIGADGRPHPNLFTIGSTLKGELWESTAVSELRDQARRLAEHIRTLAMVANAPKQASSTS